MREVAINIFFWNFQISYYVREKVFRVSATSKAQFIFFGKEWFDSLPELSVLSDSILI